MRKDVKILNVMLGAGQGGLEFVFVQHALAFKSLGYQSVALCLRKSPYISLLSGLPVFTAPSANLYNPKNYFDILKVVRSVQPDIVCLHGNRAIHFLTSYLIRPFLPQKAKLVATTHNIRNKRFYKLDMVMAISRFLMAELQNKWKIPAKKIVYCSNTIEVPAEKPVYQHHLPIVIGALRRLEYDKGLDLLLEACVILKKEHVPFKVIIAGDGSQKASYIKFCQEHQLHDDVIFLGWVSDKKSFFDQIDIFCMPSRAEGLPVALLEACAYGKPSVISDLPGPKEVIDTYGCGLVAPLNDAKGLAQALKTLILNPQQCLQMSNLAHQTVLKHYAHHCQLKWLEEMVEKCLSDS